MDWSSLIGGAYHNVMEVGIDKKKAFWIGIARGQINGKTYITTIILEYNVDKELKMDACS